MSENTLTQGLIILDQANPEQEGWFESQHWVNTPVADNRNLLTTAGVVVLRLYEGIDSDSWRHDRLELKIEIPQYVLPAGKVFKIEQWAPFLTLNAIYNVDESVNAGWAVDRFDMVLPDNMECDRYVGMYADIGVRDSDGVIYRVGYTLTMCGRFVDSSSLPGGE